MPETREVTRLSSCNSSASVLVPGLGTSVPRRYGPGNLVGVGQEPAKEHLTLRAWLEAGQVTVHYVEVVGVINEVVPTMRTWA